MKISIIFIFAFIFIFSSFIRAEEMCSLNPEKDKPSCGEKVDNDLVIEEERADSHKPTNTNEDVCSANKEDKSCGAKPKQEDPPKNDLPSFKAKKTSKYIPQPNVEYPTTFKYEDLFTRQGHEREEYLKSFPKGSNMTNYYDFSLDEDELKYVKEHKFAIIPAKKFLFTNQGNFLHFYKVAWEKKLPILLSTDSMLYALNENILKLTNSFLENAFYFTLKRFFENIVNYLESIKDDPEKREFGMLISHSQIYFGTGLGLIVDKVTKYKFPSDVDKFITETVKKAKNYGEETFIIMMKKGKINTQSLKPIGLYRKSPQLSNIYNTIMWFQLMKFHLKTDLKSIFFLGKMIEESGMSQAYKDIVELKSYLFGQDKYTPNNLEVYEIAKELGLGDLYELTKEDEDKLYKHVESIISAGKTFLPDLPFSGDVLIYTKEFYEKYKQDREEISSFFTKQNTMEDWVVNKLIDYNKEKPRLLVSSFEMMDAILHASSYRTIIFNRYKGKGSVPNEKMLHFRDGVDLQDFFERTKYSIKRSMEEEPNNWKKNLSNHYYYLLYKCTRRYKKTPDPIFREGLFKEKMFQTAWGAYTHFKRQVSLYSQRISFKPLNEDGGFPEVYIEPHLDFYTEMDNFWNNFKEKIFKYIESSEELQHTKLSYLRTQFNGYFNDMSDAIKLCIEGIKMQLYGSENSELKMMINKPIYFDKDINYWQGWYFNLFDKENPIDNFSIDLWVNTVLTTPEIEKLEFPGFSLLNIHKFPQLYYIVVEDPFEKQRKILLANSYSVKEYYKGIETHQEEMESLRRSLIERN